MQWEYVGCLILLILAFITDIKSMKIPNKITIGGIVMGIVFHTVMYGQAGLVFSLKGAGVGFGLMLILYWCRAVGGGDVKLFGGIGAWCGTSLTLSTMMYSLLAAGCIGIVILIGRRELWQRLHGVLQHVLGAIVLKSIIPIQANAKGHLQFPFMLAVLPGAAMAFYYYI
jgi:prepilin peptidase CpaA